MGAALGSIIASTIAAHITRDEGDVGGAERSNCRPAQGGERCDPIALGHQTERQPAERSQRNHAAPRDQLRPRECDAQPGGGGRQIVKSVVGAIGHLLMDSASVRAVLIRLAAGRSERFDFAQTRP